MKTTLKLTGYFSKNRKSIVAENDCITIVKTLSNNKKSYFAGLFEISKDIFDGMMCIIKKQNIEITKKEKMINQYIHGVPSVWKVTYYSFFKEQLPFKSNLLISYLILQFSNE